MTFKLLQELKIYLDHKNDYSQEEREIILNYFKKSLKSKINNKNSNQLKTTTMVSIGFEETSLESELKLCNELLTTSKELKTDAGFFESYYKILPYFENQDSAFMYINILHFKKYNSFKFLSYKKFRKTKNKSFV